MNDHYKKYIIRFLCSILLLLPISNALHFVVVDHNPQTFTKKHKNFPHNCDDYIYSPTFISFSHSNEIEEPVWIVQNNPFEIFYFFHLADQSSLTINNKGPPNMEIF